MNIGEKIDFYQDLRTNLKIFISLKKETDPYGECIEEAERIIFHINNLKIGDL